MGVCAIISVGPGNGAAFARKFSHERYQVGLLSRNIAYLEQLGKEIGGAVIVSCDPSNSTQISQSVAELEAVAGQIDVLIYNASTDHFSNIENATEADFENAWRVSTLGLVSASKQVIPSMKRRGAGNIVVIGATASIRGGAEFAPFAAAKAAQRSIAQSMARHLGPHGIHVSHVVIDGVIGDALWAQENMPDTPKEQFLSAADIAKSVYFLTQQPRSAWTFELDLRPFGEKW